MPITPAHAAVAPPLQRLLRPLGLAVPLSALVIGTMMPDFEYLIRLSPGGGSWHTLPGVVTICLPVGLLVWWVFRTLIGPALLRLLPPAMAATAGGQVAAGPTARLVPAAALGVLLGAFSHLLWDSFTHEARWGVREFPSLDRELPVQYIGPVPRYELLQYASSIVGLLIIAALIWRWFARQPRADRAIPPGQLAWRVREGGVLLLAAVAGAVLNASRPHYPALSNTLGLAAVGAMSAFAVALVIYGVVGRVRVSR
jgi:hypothetical protein